jgi:23S rRNA-/tRNA-specific pseudouridylate synthase
MSVEITAPTSGGYPSPVSPAYPAASKDVELRRAMTASADVVFEDESLAVVDKPAGVYCEALLSALPCLPTQVRTGKDF